MKKLALIALIALTAAGMGAAAPALAQTAKNTAPKPVAQVSEPAAAQISDATTLDEIVQGGLEEDRAKMLMRCVGPPPKFAKDVVAATKPASEPAITVGGGSSTGG
jgi:hypothetical protein